MRKNSSIFIILFLFLLSIIFFSCKKQTTVVYRNTVVDSARVSITNASPAVSNLLLYVDNKKISLPDSPFAYGNTTFTTYVNSNNEINPVIKQLPYIGIAAGYRQLSFASTYPSASFTANEYFQPGANYSIFITDTIAHGQTQYVVLQDKVGSSDTTHGQIRFFNLSPDSPPLDLYAFPNAGPNGYKIFSGCAYLPNDYNSLIAAESFSQIKSGPYYFIATIAGTSNILLEGGLIIPPQSVATIYAMGFVSGVGINTMDVGVILYKP